MADEPTGNLNSKLAKEIMEFLVLASKKYNQTIVMITHDLNLARYADRVLEIQDGHIIKDFQTEGEDSPIEETSIKRLDKDEIFKRAQEKLDNMEFSVHIDEEYEKWDMKTGNFVIDYNEMLRTLFFIYNEDLKTTEDKKDEKVEDVMKVYFDLFLEGMDVFARARCIEFKNMKKNKVVKSISTKEELLQFVDTFDNARWMTTKRKKMLMKAIEEKEPTFYHEGK